MKTKTRLISGRMINSLMVGTCLSLLSVADATAHNTDYRPYVVHRQYAVSHSRGLPRWLHEDRKFQRWYLANRYRLQRNLSWQRVYDIYYSGKRYRRQHGKFHGRVMHDHGYRTYRDSSGRHKHR